MTKYKEKFERLLNDYAKKYDVSKDELLYALESKDLQVREKWSKELQAASCHLAVAYGMYLREKNGTLDKRFYD